MDSSMISAAITFGIVSAIFSRALAHKKNRSKDKIVERLVFTSQNSIIPTYLPHASDAKHEEVLEKELLQWRESGFALLDNLIDAELIDGAKEEMLNLIAMNPSGVNEDFGGYSFPFNDKNSCLNQIILNPKLIDIAKRVLRTDDVLLTQGEAWLKENKTSENNSDSDSKYSNQDQRIHMDWPNHNLVHPASWYNPEVLALIIYLDNSSDCDGLTSLVAREGDKDELYKPPYTNMVGVGKHKWINDKSSTEAYLLENDFKMYDFRQKLYKREKYAKFNKGTALLYRLDVWHRGTPIRESKDRIVINIGYKKKSVHHITCWGRGYATHAYDNLWGLVPILTDDQKAVLGIPSHNDDFWKEDNNLAHYNSRYQGQ